jgi:hypothetical protein
MCLRSQGAHLNHLRFQRADAVLNARHAATLEDGPVAA